MTGMLPTLVLQILVGITMLIGLHYLYRRGLLMETFLSQGGGFPSVSLTDLTNRALDSAPTTSEAKGYYRSLLLFADDDIRKQGVKGLRILADLRKRLFGNVEFRAKLRVDDFLTPWPAWLTPLNPTMKETAPSVSEAAMAESRILAYLQKYYPQEREVDAQTGSTVRNIIDDFGYRFVFEKGVEELRLRDDFLAKPLLDGWVNPAA